MAPDVLASVEEIERVLVTLVQQLDPVGVGARSVGESVLLQLKQLDPATPGLELAKTIAAEHLPLVAEQQYGVLKRLLRTSDEELQAAIALVRACRPRPGSAVFATAAEYVVPDVFVRRQDGHWVVELNNSISPRLRVNQLYAGSLGRGEEYDALKAQLQEARWLIRSLEIRNETLLKVALAIVQRQTDFLEHGDERMRPMVLRDVAEAIEMHESTASARHHQQKYMHTPRGVFEFRYFFSSHVAGEEGEQSSTAGARKDPQARERRIAVAGRVRRPEAGVPGPGADVGARRPRREGHDHRRPAAGDRRGLKAERAQRLADAKARMEALRAQAEKIKGFLADGQITQAELDQLPADSPLRKLTNLMDDGKITTDELQSIGRGFLGNGGLPRLRSRLRFGFGHDGVKPDASPSPSTGTGG